MRILCVFQNLPCDLDALALKLAEENSVFMASSQPGHAMSGFGIKRLILKKCSVARFEKDYLGYLEFMLKTARYSCASWKALHDNSDDPDIILACSSNGAAFCLRRFFPKAFLVSYADNKLGNLLTRSQDLYAARKLTQAIQFSGSNLCFVNFPFQRDWLLNPGKSSLLPLFVDTDFYMPDGRKPGEKIIIAGGSLAEAEIRELWHLLLEIITVRKKSSVLIVAENTLRKFPWEQYIAALPESARARIRADYAMLPETWRSELRSASLVFCPAPDAAIGRRLLEAMSCGKAVFTTAADDCKCFQDNLELQKCGNAKDLLNALVHPDSPEQRGRKMREYVLKFHAQKNILPEHIDLLLDKYDRWSKGGSR